MHKLLAKIETATFGLGGYQGCRLGLHLSFSGEGFGCGTTHSFWDYEQMKRPDGARWSEDERDQSGVEVLKKVSETLAQAKCNDVSQLIGKPVELSFGREGHDMGNTLTSWRILTEVL